MKIVFIDTEYTGEHALTTLVSIALVTLEGDTLHLTLNDYSPEQVTEWLRANVLSLIDEGQRISRLEAFDRIERFLEDYAADERVTLVSAGKITDLLLLFQLWHYRCPEKKYFHGLYDLPDYLCHRAHVDLDTLFFAAGVDPHIDRDEYATGRPAAAGARHNALHDATIVRACFLKLLADGRLPHVSAAVRAVPSWAESR